MLSPYTRQLGLQNLMSIRFQRELQNNAQMVSYVSVQAKLKLTWEEKCGHNQSVDKKYQTITFTKKGSD